MASSDLSDEDDDQIGRNVDFMNIVLGKDPEETKLSEMASLVSAGATVDFQDANRGNNAPLHVAVRKKELRVVQFLIDRGANVNIRNRKNETPLDLAKRSNIPEAIRILEGNSYQQAVENPDSKRAPNELIRSTTGEERLGADSKLDCKLDETLAQTEVNKSLQFDRRAGTAGMSGQLYEIKLSMLFLLQGTTRKAETKIEQFYLAANMEKAGDFDDAVFLYHYRNESGEKRTRIIFLQTKHKEHPDNAKERINMEKLLSDDEKGDLSMKKYFTAYRKIRRQFCQPSPGDPIFDRTFEALDCDFVIYTNAFSNLEKYGTSLEKVNLSNDDVLNFSDGDQISSRSYYYYRWIIDGEKYRDVVDHLSYTSDCKKLARELAECIQTGKQMNVDKGLVRTYHSALANRVIVKIGSGEGKLRDSFLDGQDDRNFRTALFEEILKNRKITSSDMVELNTELRQKTIKLPAHFGTAKEKCAELIPPNDLVSEIEIREFLTRLKLFSDQPNEIMLSSMIEKKIQLAYSLKQEDVNLVFSFVENRMQDWWKTGNNFLTETDTMFEDANRNLAKLSLVGLALIRSGQIEKFDVQFESNQVKHLHDVIAQNQVINVVAVHGTIALSSAKVYQICKGMSKGDSSKFDYKYIFISLSSALNLQGRLIDTFRGKDNDLLIIECEPAEVGRNDGQYADILVRLLYDQLASILRQNSNKKVVIIAQQGHVLAGLFQSNLVEKYVEFEDKRNKLTDLTYESQNRILETSQLLFQGKFVNLSHLITDKTKSVLDGPVLAKLICNEEIKVDKELANLGDVNNYYVKRTLNRQTRIKNDIKLQHSFYIVTNMGEGSRFNFTDGIRDIIVISDRDSDLRELVKRYRGRNIHWLKQAGVNLWWRESHGTVSTLREFIDTRNVASCRPETITDIGDRVVLVAAEPGMGKSTLLTHFAESTKESDPTCWILRVNLNDHTRHLSQADFDGDADEAAIDFLLATSNLKTSFEKNLFRLVLQHEGNAAVMFDGFDEISPNYKEKVIQLIQILMKSGRLGKIWVTTRPHMRNELENNLGIFSYTLEPFSRNDQTQFLKEFWSKQLASRNIDNDRFKIFSDELLNLVSSSIADRETVFASVPLQLKMLAEAFQDDFAKFHDAEGPTTKPDLPTQLNLLNLYDRFIASKFNKYYLEEKRKYDLTQTGCEPDILRKSFRKKHCLLALKALFTEDDLTRLFWDNGSLPKINDYQVEVQSSKENIGLVLDVIENKPHFVHRTFAEYFAAQWLSGHLDKQEVKCFLKNHIFKKENHVVRNFFDRLLANDNEGESKYVIHTAVLNKDKNMIRELLEDRPAGETILDSPDRSGRTALHLAAAYGHSEIVELLLDHRAHVGIAENIFQWRPLSFADIGGFWNVAEMLLLNRADGNDMFTAIDSARSNTRTFRGGTFSLLEIAAEEGLKEFVRVLVEIGQANVNSKSITGALPLHRAARSGNLDIMEYLIEKGADIWAKNNTNMTALHRAAIGDRLQVVKYLVEVKKWDLNWPDNSATPPLHHAITWHSYEVLHYLVEKGVNVKAVDAYGQTPLHIAAWLGELEAIKYLISKGAHDDVGARDIHGKTPMHTAASYGKLEVVRYLVEDSNADMTLRDENGCTPLYLAAERDEWTVVEYLIRKGGDFKRLAGDGNTPLHWAAIHNQIEMVEYLLSIGADINGTNENMKTCLHQASSFGRLDIVEYLIDKGATTDQVDADNCSPVFCAGFSENWNLVRCLVNRGADVNIARRDGLTLLFLVAGSHHLDLVELLVSKGADIHRADEEGLTPLHSAASIGDLDIVKYLVSQGARVNATSKSGKVALHKAATLGNLNVIKYLVEEEKADFTVQDGDGKSPLQTAAAFGYLNIIEYLVSRGADFKGADKQGKTPLHRAALKGFLDVVDFLIDRGADIDASDTNGITPMHAAASCGQLDVVKHLINYGANINAEAGKKYFNKSPLDFTQNVRMSDLLRAHGAKSTRRSYFLADLDNSRNPRFLNVKVSE